MNGPEQQRHSGHQEGDHEGCVHDGSVHEAGVHEAGVHEGSVHKDRAQAPAVIPLGTGPVLVGTMPGQPAVVVLSAAALARRLGTDLLCAYVDVAAYPVAARSGAPGSSRPIDPDAVDDGEELKAALTARLEHLLTPSPVAWALRSLAGDPARALGALASSVGATMIVVGTRERGIGARLEDILTGSVAVHLTHRQECPVLVIPLPPGRAGSNGGQQR
ncbi:universal stress protein [Arthrobacter sp. H14-L1]|uniref:universal stress protein n=1 Tax=Arthrobacter sp. H14-L1 TaxID=2996697 RepID=UPI002270B334|nr:universal stress protein [Arthrobacter sp. H14-L1]MCY0905189.1 universal stress protein [Arthrobacter sp. H14-L1]